MNEARVQFSVSTWSQPTPSETSAARAEVLDRIVGLIDARGGHRLRVGIDGFTAAGQDESRARARVGLAERGRPVLRAVARRLQATVERRPSLRPGDGEGYYRNAFDIDAMRRLLLVPSGIRAATALSRCAASIRSPRSTTRPRSRPRCPPTACSSSTVCSRSDPRSTTSGTCASGSTSTPSSRSAAARARRRVGREHRGGGGAPP